MAEWRETTLGELVNESGGMIQTGPFGSQLHASDYVEAGIPSVMPANIGDNTIIEDGIARVTEIDAERLDRHRVVAGDILYSRRGDVERRALVRPRHEGWLCGTGCLRVHFGVEPAVEPAFVSYLLGTPWVRDWIVQHAVGATMLNLNTGILGAVPLAVPEMAEQRAIADVLGALDDKIAANTKLATTADALAVSLYRCAVKTAGRVPMSSRLDPILGGTPARSNTEFWGGDVPWISAKDITGAGHGVVLDTDEHITTHAAAATKAKPLPAGSVILTARGTVGAVARLGAPAAFNQSCYGFVPGDIPPGVLYFAILTAADEARSLAHGSVFDTITKKTFDHLPFPDLDGMAMHAVESEIGPLLGAVAAAERENLRLSTTRDTLLPALMSGRLRVEEAVERVG